MPQYGLESQHSSAGVQLLNGLNAAAAQHADREEARKHQAAVDAQAAAQRGFENQLQLHAQGAQADADTGSTHPNGPTLKLGDKDQDSARQARQGTTVKDPQGGPDQYLPTASEKEQASLNDTNSFIPAGQLGVMLEQAGHKRGSRIKASDSYSILKAVNEAQPKDEPYDIDTSGKFLGPDGKPASVMIGRKTGKVRMLDLSGFGAGAQPATPGAAPDGPFDLSRQQPGAASPVTSAFAAQQQGAIPPGTELAQPGNAPGARPGGAFSFAPTEKADRPDAQSILAGQQGPNGGILVFDKNSQSVKEVNIPKGSKAVMSASATEADKDWHVRMSELQDLKTSRRADAQQKGDDTAQLAINKLQESEKKQHDLRNIYGSFLTQLGAAEDGASIELPDAKASMTVNKKTRDSLTQKYRAKYDNATGQAKLYNDQARKIVTRRGGDAGDVPASPAQPVAAPASISTGHKVGDSVSLKSGKTITISKINPDGTFEGQ